MDVKLDFEIPKGYRLVKIGFPLSGELIFRGAGSTPYKATNDWARHADNIRVIVEHIPPEQVPLEAKDITPGCAFRKKHWAKEESWVYGTPCNRYVTFTDSEIFPVEYKALMSDWEIKYLGKDWQACSKPKE